MRNDKMDAYFSDELVMYCKDESEFKALSKLCDILFSKGILIYNKPDESKQTIEIQFNSRIYYRGD